MVSVVPNLLEEDCVIVLVCWETDEEMEYGFGACVAGWTGSPVDLAAAVAMVSQWCVSYSQLQEHACVFSWDGFGEVSNLLVGYCG